MCYIGHIKSRSRSRVSVAPVGSRKTSNRGVAVPRAGCVTENAKKECFQDDEKSRSGQPQRNQRPCQGAREGCQEGLGHKVLKEQKKRNARKDCQDRRESDGFEDHCVESCCQGCSPCEGCAPESCRCCAEGSRQAGRGRAARRGAEEGRDPASGLQGQ